ncbi:MAG: hypothetical protein WCD79_05655 [Chthoniobacteraceae bacterium]
MNDDFSIDLKQQIAHLARTIRSGLLIILVGISAMNIFEAVVLIPELKHFFDDMLHAGNVPALTAMLIGCRLALTVLSIALLGAGFIVCLFSSPERALTKLCVLIVAAFIQIAITTIALFVPLLAIIHTMSSGSGG